MGAQNAAWHKEWNCPYFDFTPEYDLKRLWYTLKLGVDHLFHLCFAVINQRWHWWWWRIHVHAMNFSYDRRNFRRHRLHDHTPASLRIIPFKGQNDKVPIWRLLQKCSLMNTCRFPAGISVSFYSAEPFFPELLFSTCLFYPVKSGLPLLSLP